MMKVIALLLCVGAMAGDPTEELAKQLFGADAPVERPPQELQKPVRAYNGQPCGYRPQMNLPIGCELVCIGDQWQQMCR